jgi:hypothetical protein
MARHIFVDNSNIYGGAQRASEILEPNALKMSVRLYYRNFFNLIEGPEVATRVLAGSVPPGNEPLWQTARDLGYDTDLLKRVEQDDGSLTEQAVDEMLHLKMANAMLDFDSPQTLVIASGDGRESNWQTSFPEQAQRALRIGWNVEVWSWSEQLTKNYDPLCRANLGRIKVKTLNPYYRSITFVQAGTYRVNGANVTIVGRVVSPLHGEGEAGRAA